MQLAPHSTITPGRQVGLLRQEFFGVPQPAQPIFTGASVGPVDGWASVNDARTAVAALTRSDPHFSGGSLVGLFRDGPADRVLARYVVDAHGGDVRLWHIPGQVFPTDQRLVEFVDGPTMPFA